jgi:hypothetical protein
LGVDEEPAVAGEAARAAFGVAGVVAPMLF